MSRALALRTHERHGEVAKLAPQILKGVQPDQGGYELPDPFDTAHTADRPASENQPHPPIVAKSVVPLIVEFDETKGCREGEEEEHGIEEDETGNTEPTDIYVPSAAKETLFCCS